MTSLKQTEQDVYDYLNKRFRIGWSLKEVTEFYSKLTYRQTIDEAADINKALGTNIYLNSEDNYTNQQNLPKWSIRGFIKEIYDSREEIQNRLTAPPIAPEPILTKTTKKVKDKVVVLAPGQTYDLAYTPSGGTSYTVSYTYLNTTISHSKQNYWRTTSYVGGVKRYIRLYTEASIKKELAERSQRKVLKAFGFSKGTSADPLYGAGGVDLGRPNPDGTFPTTTANNSPLTYTPTPDNKSGSGDQEFMDNIASSQMEAGE